MPSPYHTTQRKVEDALARYLATKAGTGLAAYTVYKGASMGTLSTPRVEITAGEAEPERIADTITGNWRVTATVAVVSHKDDRSRTQHAAACGEWGDALFQDDIVSVINTAEASYQFKVFQLWPGRASDLMSQSELRSEYECEVYCRPSTPT